jgi:thiol-disulfide isomerase/thioredoxin
MRISSIFGLTTISILLIACQSNSFKIKGHISGLTEGDTLILANDLNSMNENRIHGEKIAVDKKGHFEYSGIAGSIERCVLYNPKSDYNYYVFFREPGVSLNMNLNAGTPDQEGYNSINGSKLNDDLTSITNSVEKLQKEISKIAKSSPTSRLSEEKQNKIKMLEQKIRTMIIHGINDNAKNELGYYLLTSYSQGWGIDENVIRSLINNIPPKIRKREKISKMISLLRIRNNSSIGKLITGFQMLSPEGKDVPLYKEIKKNKITIIDFWASWCEPCRAEIPDLAKLYKSYHSKGLGIISISFDSDAEKWKKAIKDMNMKWVQMSDLRGWESVGAQGLGITSIPFKIIVDANGVILSKDLKGKELTDFIKDNL